MPSEKVVSLCGPRILLLLSERKSTPSEGDALRSRASAVLMAASVAAARSFCYQYFADSLHMEHAHTLNDVKTRDGASHQGQRQAVSSLGDRGNPLRAIDLQGTDPSLLWRHHLHESRRAQRRRMRHSRPRQMQDLREAVQHWSDRLQPHA